MGLIIAVLGIAVTALLCSRRFHDFLLTRWDTCRPRKDTGKSRRSGRTGYLRLGMQLTAALIFLCSFFFALRYVHTHIIPLPMAGQILAAFDPDVKVWEENIERRELGDLGAAHEEWSESRGMGYEHSRYWQEELWANWRDYAEAGTFAFGLGLLALAFFISLCQKRFPARQSKTAAPAEPTRLGTRKKRVTKIRRTKVRILAPGSLHKALRDDVSKPS